MKILINRKPVEGPWGGGNLFVTAFYDEMKLRGHEVVTSFSNDIDAIFVQDPRPSGDLGISINEIYQFKRFKPDVKIFHRINECDERKNTDFMNRILREASAITDVSIFVSDWIKEHHNNLGWKCKKQFVVRNGVNLEHFKKREKRNNGKINIVTHHWSNNYLKGFDVYNWLDNFVKENSNDFTFTYIGREMGTFQNTIVIQPLSGIVLGLELSAYDVYITGTKFDPGPNHVLESLACELPTYSHIQGGGAVEFVGSDHTYCDLDDLENLLKEKNYNQNITKVQTWKESLSKYCDIIEDEVKNGNS